MLEDGTLVSQGGFDKLPPLSAVEAGAEAFLKQNYPVITSEKWVFAGVSNTSIADGYNFTFRYYLNGNFAYYYNITSYPSLGNYLETLINGNIVKSGGGLVDSVILPRSNSNFSSKYQVILDNFKRLGMQPKYFKLLYRAS